MSQHVRYRGKARARPVVSQSKVADFEASLNLNLLKTPSTLITHASHVHHSRSMDDFHSLSEDEKVNCTYYKKSI